MYPHFLAMKNRERAIENHKASIREKNQKNKKRYLGQPATSNSKSIKLRRMSRLEFLKFKRKLERSAQQQDRLRNLFILASFVVVIIVTVFLAS